MNVDQQQQQQQQQYSAPTNYHQYDATPATALPPPTVIPQPPTSATYVTIGLMPQTGYNLNAAAAGATTATQNLPITATTMMPATSATTPTSSFKTTPLLPMPTLEDIECGAIGAGVGGVGGSVDSSGIMIVSGAPDGNILPPGILKYSSMPTPAFTTTPTMPMMALPTQLRSATSPPLPPPPAASASSAAQQQSMTTAHTTTSDACGTLKSNNKLTSALSATQQRMAQTLQQTTAAAPPPPLPEPGLLSTSSTIASNIAIGSGGIGCSNSSSSAIINNAGGAGNNKSNNSNSNSKNNSTSNLNSKRHKTKRKCCSCFGGDGGHDVVGGADAASSKYSASKKTKKAQTIWAGLLTNLGICALLLAYTLLGSFIFLTIENEDSSLLHLQRTLASTKRVAGVGLNGELGRGSGSESRNIYHTQPRHLDNGTVAAVSYSSPSSSSSSSATSSSSSSASAGTSAMNGNHEFGISDSQLALSAETYDVRQRTIENIWDITVSLNILYKENWTKLAALEIAKFQDQLVKRLNEDALLQLTHDLDVNGHGGGNSPATEAVLLLSHQHGVHGGIQQQQHEWNFAKAFLYSLTVLTTIGYGNIAPKTTLGRLVTLAYAILGIPLTLVYLSSTGGILAKVAREVFSKALCCCMCSNCGYCCYDEKRMAEKERRMKRKRQQEELRKQQAAMQEPYYVRSGSLHSSFQSPDKHPVGSSNPMMSGTGNIPDIDSLSASESRGSMHGLSILAPILLCLSMMIIYILFGAVVLYRLEEWPMLDGIYFCFMSLSTIGFGDLVPGLRKESTTTTWFCSIYIMSGMALTAMCFNVIHEEIVHRIKIVVEFKKAATLDAMNDEQGYYMTAPPP